MEVQGIELRPIGSQMTGDATVLVTPELREAWDRYEALRALRQLRQLRDSAMSEVHELDRRADAMAAEMRKAGWLS